MQSAQDTSRERDSLELLSFARLIWRRKAFMLACLIAWLAAGVLYLSSATRVYRATTRLLVERQFLEPRTQLRHEPAFVATQAEIVGSRAVVEDALETFTPTSMGPATNLVESLLAAIRVTPVEGTNVLQLSLTCADSDEAVQMLAALVGSYREYLSDSEKDTQLEALAFLTEKEEELRGQLGEKQSQYRTLCEQSTLSGISEDAGRVRTEYLTNLGKALTDAKSRHLKLDNQLTAWIKSPAIANLDSEPRVGEDLVPASARVVDEFAPAFFQGNSTTVPHESSESIYSLLPIGEAGQFAEIRDVATQLYQAQQWEQELDRLHGDRHPDLQEARSRIKSLRSRLKEMLTVIPTVLENELEAARNIELELQTLYETEVERAKRLDLQQLEEQQFVDTIDRLKAAHDSILAEMHARQLAGASAANGLGTVHVKSIAAPRSSGKPVWPVPAVLFSICGVLGLCTGIGGIVTLERFL